jgi:hypothetical protein
LPLPTLMGSHCAGRCHRYYILPTPQPSSHILRHGSERRRVSVGTTALVHILFDDNGVVGVRLLFLVCWLALPIERRQHGVVWVLRAVTCFTFCLAPPDPAQSELCHQQTDAAQHMWAHALLPRIMHTCGSGFLFVNKCWGSNWVVIKSAIKEVNISEGKAGDVVGNNHKCIRSGAPVAKAIGPSIDVHLHAFSSARRNDRDMLAG